MVSEEVCEAIEHLLTFLHVRIKHTERMGQTFIPSEVHQFAFGSVSAQGYCEVQRVLTQMIVMAGNQETGRQILHNLGMLRIGEGYKCGLLIVSSIERFRQENVQQNQAELSQSQ